MARKAMTYRRSTTKGAAPRDAWPEGASETYLKGAVLVSDGSGRAQEGGASPTAILGVAIADGENNSTEGAAEADFITAGPGIRFEASIDDNGDLGNGASALTDLGLEYGVTQDSDGVWYVDKGVTGANARAKVRKLVDAAGTTNGRVEIEFTHDHLFNDAS